MLIPDRGILAVDGGDAVPFLQGLLTNDVSGLLPGGAAHACLLTAQGRFLHDMFVVRDGERRLLDCEAHRRDDLLARLLRYRLRAKVEITDEAERYAVYAQLPSPLPVGEADGHRPAGEGLPAPDTAPHPGPLPQGEGMLTFPDPRHEALGYRAIVPAGLDFPFSRG